MADTEDTETLAESFKTCPECGHPIYGHLGPNSLSLCTGDWYRCRCRLSAHAAVTAAVLASSWLAARDERIRADEREKLAGLVSDWQANGNSRELGDPRADVWQKCATQLLGALRSLDAR